MHLEHLFVTGHEPTATRDGEGDISMSAEPVTFEAGKYLTQIQGRDYLEVKWRLLWLRTEHPDAAIETELVRDEGSVAVFKARVVVPGGGSATGWGQESERDFPDYLEKAETKALGRALAALGYGTQFCQDFDFGATDRALDGGRVRVVDSPVDFGAGRTLDARRGPRPMDLLTEKQLKAIYAIGHGRGLAEAEVARRSQETFGCPPEQLERRDASTFIDQLKQARPVGAPEVSA
jgi:hypothetical protein